MHLYSRIDRLAAQIGNEETAYERRNAVGLDRELGEQKAWLGLEDSLQYLVLDDGAVCERKAPFENLLQGGRIVQLVVQTAEETDLLPGDGRAMSSSRPPGKYR